VTINSIQRIEHHCAASTRALPSNGLAARAGFRVYNGFVSASPGGRNPLDYHSDVLEPAIASY